MCHTQLDLLSILEDEASRELLKEVSKLESYLATSVLLYVGLFKPGKSKLNNSRALKLLNETLSLTGNKRLLSEACDATVLAIREKRKVSQAKPLKDHQYLKRVIENMVETSATVNTSTRLGSNIQIKEQGVIVSPEEAQRQHEEMLARYKNTKGS